jgi:membrane-bound lytic murein transglycosylase B
MSGGTAGVWGSVLAAGDAQDALRRIETVNRVVTADRARTDQFAQVADGARAAAVTADRGAEQAVLRAADVDEAYSRMTALLDAARARLAALDARAQQLAAVEEAQRQLAELQRQADAAALARAATATARVVPADYFALYRAAAATCPGLPWTVVAAIGQVETGHGTNVAVSSAGAQGPMQFMPATFAAYAVDGDGDGRRDIMSPAESVYLCANGGGKPGGLSAAIWQYNHADWYVAMVLRIAGQLAASPPPR